MNFKTQQTRDIKEKHILDHLRILEEKLQDAIQTAESADQRVILTNEIILKINEYLLELEYLS